MEKPKIIVTGFGPFGAHKINASWEAVKLLPSLNINDEFQVELLIFEIPVEYVEVKKIIPELWEKYKPILVIHVGVSSVASEITLEVQANRTGYCLFDIKGYVPNTGCCFESGEECIKSLIKLPEISVKVTEEKDVLCNCVTSSNAGRYLCEFTYYTSLKIDNSRCLFIHVPELGKPYSALELAQGIKSVICGALECIKSK